MRRALLVLLVAACSSSPDTSSMQETPLEPITRENQDSNYSALHAISADAPRADGGPITRFLEYGQTIDRVANMISDDRLITRAEARGLDVLEVMWEDTGRAWGSALGPNISDLTLQVRRESPWVKGAFVTALMPVLRFPNFTDKTGDVSADQFFVRVGNEHDGELKSVKLTELLKNIREFASDGKSIKGTGNLLAAKDTHFLVSAQAVFLPIPKSGQAEFNPVLFNYQSAPGSPAVLAILVTRQGTSIQVIENKPEESTSVGWGQELYFNNRGQRSSFTAERRTDVVQRIEAQGGPLTEDDRTSLQKGADVIFLIQVPLKHKNVGYLGGTMEGGYGFGMGGGGTGDMAQAAPAAKPLATTSGNAPKQEVQRSDVEQAVVGHGPNLGPFREGRDLELVRDDKFPVRVTIQFYKATSNGIVSNEDLDAIKKSIDGVYKHADFVGSLVIPDGDPLRPTAWQKVPNEWFPW